MVAAAIPATARLSAAVDGHHIIHWVDGGPTALDNLVHRKYDPLESR
jgi:hypothetical protein